MSVPLLNPKGPSTQTVVVPTVSLRPLPRVSGAHSHRLSLSCHLKLRPRRREENGCVSRKLPSAITKSSRGHKKNRKCQGNQKSGSGGRRQGRVCWCDGPRCSHLLLKRTPDTWALSWLPARLGRNANLRQAHPRPQRRERKHVRRSSKMLPSRLQGQLLLSPFQLPPSAAPHLTGETE